MLYRTWVFFIAFAAFMFLLGSSGSTPLEPPVDVDVEVLHKTGAVSARHIEIVDGDWGDDFFYSSSRNKIKAVLFPLLPESQIDLGAARPEIRILFKVPVPKGTSEDGLDAMIPDLLPESRRGCVSEIDDDTTVKGLLNSGYQVKTPLVVISPCVVDLEARPMSLWGLLALPILGFGLFRFLRLFRRGYVDRKSEAGYVDEPALPAEVSVKEAIRSAKAGFSQWQMLRESFLDALMFYVPDLVFYRLKEALPLELAKASLGAVRQAIQARRDGRLREHLGELARDRLVVASNASSLALVLVMLLLAAIDAKGLGALFSLALFLAYWLFFARYLRLGARKAFSVAFVFGFIGIAAAEVIPMVVEKEGYLLRLPLIDASVIHVDLLSLPFLPVYALFCYVVLTYLYRGVFSYFMKE
jgi:hypothetical protein